MLASIKISLLKTLIEFHPLKLQHTADPGLPHSIYMSMKQIIVMDTDGQ